MSSKIFLYIIQLYIYYILYDIFTLLYANIWKILGANYNERLIEIIEYLVLF